MIGEIKSKVIIAEGGIMSRWVKIRHPPHRLFRWSAGFFLIAEKNALYFSILPYNSDASFSTQFFPRTYQGPSSLHIERTTPCCPVSSAPRGNDPSCGSRTTQRLLAEC